MRSCPVCEAANGETDDFCGSCGSYLGWSQPSATPAKAGATVEPPAPPPSAERAPRAAAPASPGEGGRRDADADGDGDGEDRAREDGTERAATPSPEVEPTRRAGRGRAVESAAAPEPGGSGGSRGPGGPDAREPGGAGWSGGPGGSAGPGSDRSERSESPGPVPPGGDAVAPVRPGAGTAVPPPPGGDAVVPVQPAKPIARRPVVRTAPEAEETAPGPACPACGTPNAPERRFCRRCAAGLTPSQAPTPLPWWRTRWPFRRRVRVGSSGRVLRRLLAILVVLALAVAAVLLIPAGRALFEGTLDKLGGATEISPSRATASAAVPQHPAERAADGLSNRYWGAPALGDSISFGFGTPFRLVAVVVHTGTSAKAQDFRLQARPVRADLVVTSADGERHTKQLTLNDKPGPQTVQLGISDVVDVRLIMRAAAGMAPGRHIALAEVEFFKRS